MASIGNATEIKHSVGLIINQIKCVHIHKLVAFG